MTSNDHTDELCDFSNDGRKVEADESTFEHKFENSSHDIGKKSHLYHDNETVIMLMALAQHSQLYYLKRIPYLSYVNYQPLIAMSSLRT